MPIDYSKWDRMDFSDDDSPDESIGRPTAPAPSSSRRAASTRSAQQVTPPKIQSSSSPNVVETKPASKKKEPKAEKAKMKATARKPVPQLPVELWLRIFYFNDSPLHLWNDGRTVCKLWRAWIPRIFAQKYFQDRNMTSIHYELGTSERQGRFSRLAMVMSFARFDPQDRTRAVFSQDKEYLHSSSIGQRAQKRREAQNMRLKLWEESIGKYQSDKLKAGGRPGLSPHIVMLKSRANDTQLSGLSFDLEAHEISFKWQDMLQNFLQEAAEYERRNEEGTANVPRLMAEAQALMSRDSERAIAIIMGIYNANVDVRKNVRRERLVKQYKGYPILNFKDAGYLKKEAHVLQAITEAESEADLTLTAESAEELKKARATQKDLPAVSDEADQYRLMRKAESSTSGYAHDGDRMVPVTRLPNFVDMVQWWEDDEQQ